MYKITSYKFINREQPDTILYLHGWGCNYNYMLNLSTNNEDFNDLYIDLPGFGDNLDLDIPLTLNDYAVCIQNLLTSLHVHIAYIVGHSFGGKISIQLSTLLNVKGYFLIAPSIFHKKRTLLYFIKIYTYKLFKRIPFLKRHSEKMGSEDYKNAKGALKKTMSNVINADVNSYLKAISAPILLIFSKDDFIVPKKLGKKIVKRAQDAALLLIEGDHFAFLSQKPYLSSILHAFVENTYAR